MTPYVWLLIVAGVSYWMGRIVGKDVGLKRGTAISMVLFLEKPMTFDVGSGEFRVGKDVIEEATDKNTALAVRAHVLDMVGESDGEE